jgi:hypothetical protein
MMMNKCKIDKNIRPNKIFLGGPFKSLVDEDSGMMELRWIDFYRRIISMLEEKGYSVHNAHSRESWGQKMMPPRVCTKIDFEEISECDLFIAFPGTPASPGTHIEIGWASALKKDIVLLVEQGHEYCFMLQGLGTIANVSYLTYRNSKECLEKLSILCEKKCFL